jgi:predicted site-specific integrase-resolvase
LSALPLDREHLIVSEVCTIFRINETSLRRWRRLGIGPKYIKTEGGKILYPRADVERYLTEHTHTTRGSK